MNITPPPPPPPPPHQNLGLHIEANRPKLDECDVSETPATATPRPKHGPKRESNNNNNNYDDDEYITAHSLQHRPPLPPR
jgi:hypothetical protein